MVGFTNYDLRFTISRIGSADRGKDCSPKKSRQENIWKNESTLALTLALSPRRGKSASASCEGSHVSLALTVLRGWFQRHIVSCQEAENDSPSPGGEGRGEGERNN